MRMSYDFFLLLMLPILISGGEVPDNRQCATEVTFCFDVAKSRNTYTHSNSFEESDLRLSLTVRKLGNTPHSHHWVIWLSEELDGFTIIVTFDGNQTVADSMRIHLNKFEDELVRLSLTHVSNASMLQEEEKEKLITIVKSDDNTIVFESSALFSQRMRLEESKQKVTVWFQSTRLTGTRVPSMESVTTAEATYLFVGPKKNTAKTPSWIKPAMVVAIVILSIVAFLLLSFTVWRIKISRGSRTTPPADTFVSMTTNV